MIKGYHIRIVLVTGIDLKMIKSFIFRFSHLDQQLDLALARIPIQDFLSLRDKYSWLTVEIDLNQSVDIHFYKGYIFEFILTKILTSILGLGMQPSNSNMTLFTLIHNNVLY